MKKILIVIIFIYSILNAGGNLKILAPATPSSIPVIIAAQNREWKVNLFMNHSKAHSMFINNKADILITGLSVGKKFFEQQIPVKIVNTYVSGLSYLVSYNERTTGFRNLKNKTVYLPFKGSPLEEVTKYFIRQEGLDWKQDFDIQYAPFSSSVNLLLDKKIENVVLPEPFVSSALNNNKSINVVFSYKELWNKYTNEKNGYPQVACFIKSDKDFDSQLINEYNKSLQEGIQLVRAYPDSAVKLVIDRFNFSQGVLLGAINRTEFLLLTGDSLKHEIYSYYKILGKPLNETYQDFFLDY